MHRVPAGRRFLLNALLLMVARTCLASAFENTITEQQERQRSAAVQPPQPPPILAQPIAIAAEPLRNVAAPLVISSLTNGRSSPIDNSIGAPQGHKHVNCGEIVSNSTHLLIRNPHHPEATYSKTICEIVIERAGAQVKQLKLTLKRLELYRPTLDGVCLHDRFAVFTDLNLALTPIMCGNLSGKVISIPFELPHTSLIVSIGTSDLDHDRFWTIEAEQVSHS